ncbi:type II secretion system GspH family protein [Paenibacillus glycanilyticus]|uniref:competence type IV pilus major pilin ComGC n=1 Tax=Paenibacillus glycanilyticus TaxID=126569 RepID=UPI00203E7613|nr:type II secretion system protein [Paenibacillus glycanilyticus]MCM3627151.1 type II secretion system GspH family protein [Paenibacillus glycanilyticus]
MLKKVMKRLKKEEKGFTLIELLAVIVILAVIAVIAVPLIGKIIDNTKKDADVATAQQLYDAARLYVTGELDGDFNGKSVTFKNLVDAGYIASNTSLPSTKAQLNDTSSVVTFNATGELQSVALNGKSYTAAQIKDGKAPATTATPTAT